VRRFLSLLPSLALVLLSSSRADSVSPPPPTDRIANTERHLDLAKAHNDRAVDETKELEALNKSIFRPTCASTSRSLFTAPTCPALPC